jgi:hypothetical protein
MLNTHLASVVTNSEEEILKYAFCTQKDFTCMERLEAIGSIIDRKRTHSNREMG